MKRLTLTLLSIFLFWGCGEHLQSLNKLQTIPVKNIPISGKASLPQSEISGLAWHGDMLILLPQYPYAYEEDGTGKIFSIPKNKLIDYINGSNKDKIIPDEINFNAPGLERFNGWGSGYEAITFNGDTAYFTIESFEKDSTIGYVVLGVYHSDNKEIVLDASTLRKIPSQTNIENFSDEAILIWNKSIITLHEINNSSLVSSPVANMFDSKLNEIAQLPFPNIEFRITDATEADEKGDFWVINYFYPGEKISGSLANDRISESYGVNKFLKKDHAIERLLKMQISNEKISLADTPPIYLDFTEFSDGRNWEGIVQLDSLGFILVTDKFPQTILAFVPAY